MWDKYMCSVCLISSDSVHLYTSLRLRMLYKRLASPESKLFPGMHIKLCYLCHAAFQKIAKFIEVASESYEKLKKCDQYGVQISKIIISQEKSKVHNLSITTIPSITIHGESDNTSFCKNVIVKQEYIDPNEESNISSGENNPEQPPVQTNIKTANNPTQTIETISPLSNKRISVTLSLPANHTIKKMTGLVNPTQNGPVAKSLPFSQFVTKNQILLNAEKKRNKLYKDKAMPTTQSLLKILPKTTRLNKILLKPEVLTSKLKMTNTSQVKPISITNTIPKLIRNIAPKKTLPSLVPIPTSSCFPVFTSAKQNNGMNISFTASAPTTVPIQLPTLLPFTYVASNCTLPTEQSLSQNLNNAGSKMLTGPSKPKNNKLIPYIVYKTGTKPSKPNNKPKKITRVLKATKNRPIYIINRCANTSSQDKLKYPTNEPSEPDDCMKANIDNSTINDKNSKDANKMNETTEKLTQKEHNTGVMNFIKIAPKPDGGINNSRPTCTEISDKVDKAQVKEFEPLEKFSYENKNHQIICKVEEEVEHIKILYEDDPMEEAEQKYLINTM